MSEISDLQATIRACREKITMIQNDIVGIGNANRTISRHVLELQEQKVLVDDFDMTVEDTWRKNLCDTAIEYKTNVSTGFDDAVTECSNIISDLNTCIKNANDEIEKLKNRISECERRIEAIRAEEERRRREEARKRG